MAPFPRSIRRAAALLAVPALVAGCGTISVTAPPATPTDFPGIAGRLNAAGIKLSDWVSGDPGCGEQGGRVAAALAVVEPHRRRAVAHEREVEVAARQVDVAEQPPVPITPVERRVAQLGDLVAAHKFLDLLAAK